MELSVTDWTFPITPERGGTAFTWAQTVFGVACAASKEMNATRTRRCIMKAFLQLSVMRTLVRYNTFLRVMRSLLNKFQYTNEETRSVDVSLWRRRYRRDFGTSQPDELHFCPPVRRVEEVSNQQHGFRRPLLHQPVRAWSTSPVRRFCCPWRPEKKR